MNKPKIKQKQSEITNLNEKIDFLRQAAFALVDEVKSLDVPFKIETQNDVNFGEEVRRFEIYLIEQALDRAGGNQHRAARLLNLKYTTLNSKIKRYRISPVHAHVAERIAFSGTL